MMKKLIIAIGLGLFIAGFAVAQVSRGGTLYVAVKTVSLKSSTGFFASTKGTLNYGDRVTVLQVNGNWVEIRSSSNSSLSGWTPSANMSSKRIVSGNTNTTTAQELALAGKGFNQEIEDAYKVKKDLNYADVDRTEALTVNEAELYRFLEAGLLSTGEQ
jgi:uncharacterized protein YgiM (DUF1202 family)